ncbi:MAG: MBL fold metallo-hydrolase [Planctomycetota bacterium]
MIVEQHYLDCLSQASYLVVDGDVAVVIDPRRDVDVYLEAAVKHDAVIRHVLLTHMHADFVAGHLELAERTGAKIYVGRHAGATYAHEPVDEGRLLEFGDVRIDALDTPGHTPEGISYVLSRPGEPPHAVFTGDTLFVGDVGRPDLMSSVGHAADELARDLYRSLHDKLMTLPDETLVYPGHGAGSMCGKNLSSDTTSTIGRERRTNHALAYADVDAFVAGVTADQPAAPAYFAHDAVMNRSERGTLDEALATGAQALDLDRVLALVADGARVLDVRDAESFAAAHLASSTNVPLGGRFASWVGTVLFDAPRLVIVASPGDEREATLRLGRVGLDRVVGYLAKGPAAWAERPEVVRSIQRVDWDQVTSRVLDVRQPGEWEAGHVDGALHVPLGELEARLDELPRDEPLAVVCASSYRSSIAASLLARHGFENLVDVRGGMQARAAAAR